MNSTQLEHKLSDGNGERKPSVLKDCHATEKTVIIYIWTNVYNLILCVKTSQLSL